MTDRIHIDRLSSDDLDALYARAEGAEKLLREVVDLAELSHRYGAMGGHDRAGINLGCAGCELHRRIRAVLDGKPAAPLTDQPKEQA